MRFKLGISFMIFLLAWLPGNAAAMAANNGLSKSAQLDVLEKQMAQAKARYTRLLADADEQAKAALQLRQQLAQAAAAQQQAELQVAQIHHQIELLHGKEGKIKAKLTEDEASMLELLAAISTFERQRPPTLAVHGQDASQAVRAALLMGATIPALKQRANYLSAELNALLEVRAELKQKSSAMHFAMQDRQRRADQLNSLLQLRQKNEQSLRSQAREQEQLVAQLGDDASDLRDLINKLNEAVEKKMLTLPAAKTLTFSSANSFLTTPVIGFISGRFGQNDPSGRPIWGVKYKAPDKALVVAPFDGLVEYAGPFKGYGRLVIVNVGGGYHIILSGIEGLNVRHRQSIIAGEPVGVMGVSDQEELYLELRHKGKPVDPAPWLARATAGLKAGSG